MHGIKHMTNRIWLLVLCTIAPFLLLTLFLQPSALALLSSHNDSVAGCTHCNLSQIDQLTSSKVDAALQSVMTTASADESIRFIVHLRVKSTLPTLTNITNLTDHRTQLVASLQETAVSSQSALIPTLDALKQSGDISQYRSLWINNSIAVTGNSDVITQLSLNASVASITLDVGRQYFKNPDQSSLYNFIQATTGLTSSIKSWGIDKIMAPAVWHGLGITGTGVTVAIMDSGVDWQHPDLLPNYRGNLGNNSFDHTSNWYYPVDPSVTVPTDTLGHGTHVAGTAVGQNGIGVAPGANWIAVGLTDKTGLIYDSNIHAGFEWLLAPGGNSALAPDIINNSWGAPNTATTFYEDIEVLQAAGIITIFSAGNDGPSSSTISTPGSYTNTIAIGASDEIDEVAWFSSRGPSLLTDEVHPHIVAPGTQIISSLPNNTYGILHGTSMAAPHTAGTTALMLAANPALTREQVLARLKGTAVSIAPTHPNFDSGWGRLNAYEAVKPYVNTGSLQGVVTGNGQPLPSVVVTITNSTGQNFYIETDTNGNYQASLRPGVYEISSAPFGFFATTLTNITVIAGQTTTQNINLTAVPQGTIYGTVVDNATNLPISGAKITVEGMSITAVTNANGQYSISIPLQQAKLTATATGYRLSHAIRLPNQTQSIQQNFSLTSSPNILLVDAGSWGFASKIDYYKSSLNALNYAFDSWPIRHPVNDTPSPDDLTGYDVVIWSDPRHSPGFIDATGTITNFLESGGNLLISGQNLAAYDGSFYRRQAWWGEYLGAIYTGKTAVSHPLTGTENTAFSGLSFTLNGNQSAQNQVEIDTSHPSNYSFITNGIFTYKDDFFAGLQATACQPYNLIYLGFGLEGVNSGQARQEILQRAFNAFDASPTMIGSRWENNDINEFAVRGDQLVYTVTLRNLSETVTDTFTISAESQLWETNIVTETLTLGPCAAGKTAVSITVPANVASDSFHNSELTAVSGFNPFDTSTLTLQHKTPGDILLVDDDRWYDQRERFTAQLDSMHLRYDVWSTSEGGLARPSPSTKFLNEFDIVVWFTGYDWFAPITSQERASLTTYLQNGGRLFLTSQDFLFYHQNTTLTRDLLGVIDYRESISPTAVYAGHRPQTSVNIAGPLEQSYDPYRNFSDGIIPGTTSTPLYWHNEGLPAAIATDGGNYRAVLMSLPLETITETVRLLVMNDIVGWLGDLGDSSFIVDQRTGGAGAARTYTITIRNIASAPANWVTAVNTLPANLTIDVNSISGGATYNPATRELRWSSELASGAVHQISYQATPANGLPAATLLENKLTLKYDRHNLVFDQFANIWISTPDLTQSTISAEVNKPLSPTAVTYTIQLHNNGLAATNGISSTWVIPDRLNLITSTVTTTGGTASFLKNRLIWQGDLNPGQMMTITLPFTRTAATKLTHIPTAIIIQDGVTSTLLREHELILKPYQVVLPIVAKE